MCVLRRWIKEGFPFFSSHVCRRDKKGLLFLLADLGLWLAILLGYFFLWASSWIVLFLWAEVLLKSLAYADSFWS
jgi:hypothetical protein